LPYVGLSLKQDDAFKIVASHGTTRTNLFRLPLIYHVETLGELLLAPRAGSGSFTRNERLLLQALGRQAGIALHGVLLTIDLERSRQRIVTAREEARRRLGSDLHDGLGHMLAGVLRKVETTAHLLEQDPQAAQHVLIDIKQQTKSAIDAIRLLAHTLHPPELELLGVVKALRERVQQYDQPNESGLRVTIEAPLALPSLPIAVESAIYYIALEALSNVQRHAQARHCHLRLALLASDDTANLLPGVWNASVLELEICDDGRGLPEEAQEKGTGLGFASMRERATELGGTCLIENVATRGAHVHVRLPRLQTTDDRR
jgi:signal transduction histidine kinase